MKLRNQWLSMLIAAVAGGVGFVAQAAEVSLVSGVFQSDDTEGPVDYKENRISLNGRYGDGISHSKNLMWYADAGLSLISYSGDAAPDDSTGIMVGGGVRLFFDTVGDRFRPFLGTGGAYRSDQTVDGNGNAVKNSGLYYNMAAGLRFTMGTLAEFDLNDVTAFLDLEAQLFESALFATRKVESADPAVEDTKTTETDLFVGSTGSLDSMTVGLGFQF